MKKIKHEFKKQCRRCKKEVPLKLFYVNRQWTKEFFKDAWCRDCVRSFVVDENTLKIYCNENQRGFSQKLLTLSYAYVDEMYKKPGYKANLEVGVAVEDKYWLDVRKQYFKNMGMSQYYDHSDRLTKEETKEQELIVEYEKEHGIQIPDEILDLDYGPKSYNKFWCGTYTQGELNYLEDYFSGLQRDFKLENASYIDYAKKVSKASLAMDRAFSDLCDGKLNADKKYKDLKDIFDQLSQSAKFAEKTRSENDSVGFGSLGELIKRMETTGHLQKPVKFAKDDIDNILNDFRWIISSVGDG